MNRTGEADQCGRWLRSAGDVAFPLVGDALLERLATDLSVLSPQLRKAAAYLIRERGLARDFRITDFARLSGTTPITVVRLAKRYGFQGYYELKFAFLDSERIHAEWRAESDPHPEALMSEAPCTAPSGFLSRTMCDAQSDAIQGAVKSMGVLGQLLGHSSFATAAQWVNEATEIWVHAASGTHPLVTASVFEAFRQTGRQVRSWGAPSDPQPRPERPSKSLHIHLALTHGLPAVSRPYLPETEGERAIWLAGPDQCHATSSASVLHMSLPLEDPVQVMHVVAGLVAAWGNVGCKLRTAH